jgi:hypothetical protein
VTIKHPPAVVDGVAADNSVGKIYDLPPNLAILMMAAGWMRNETRAHARRESDHLPTVNRRRATDRRSVE